MEGGQWVILHHVWKDHELSIGGKCYCGAMLWSYDQFINHLEQRMVGGILVTAAAYRKFIRPVHLENYLRKHYLACLMGVNDV